MGIKQFLGIKWMDEKPKILLYDIVTHSMQYEDFERNDRSEKNNGKTL